MTRRDKFVDVSFVEAELRLLVRALDDLVSRTRRRSARARAKKLADRLFGSIPRRTK